MNLYLVSDDTGHLETCFDLSDATSAALDMLASGGLFLIRTLHSA